MKSLILIPLSFPYSQHNESSFLQHEIKYLKKEFSNFIILPSENKGEKRVLDNSYIVDESFAQFSKKSLNTSSYLIALFSLAFLSEIFRKPSLLVNKQELIKILDFIKNTFEVKSFLKNMISKTYKKEDKIIFYTYWTTHITFALGLLAKKNKNITIITRMHGYDLYEERGYVVCQKQILKNIKYVFFVSECGLNYIKNKYKYFETKLILAPLGVEKQDIQNPNNIDGVIKIASCSSIDNNKRVEIIYDALIILAKSGKKIIWTHFGTGKNESILKSKIEQNRFSNFVINLYGQVPSELLMNFYKQNPLDFFITTTASEGGRPVSIQEAMSFGIPIIATSVGGIPEIVDSTNGILLEPNPDPEDVADAICKFMSNNKTNINMRNASYLIWEQKCNSSNNFRNFSYQLKTSF